MIPYPEWRIDLAMSVESEQSETSVAMRNRAVSRHMLAVIMVLLLLGAFKLSAALP